MATTEQYLTQLQADKQALVDNLVEKGVEATANETFTSLVPKVLDIQSGGTEITKGFRIDNFNENGYATEITVIGFTSLPDYYFYYAGYKSGSKTTWGGNSNLKINLPENLTSIGSYAFAENDAIYEIELPSSLTYIGNECFYSCYNLSKMEIPNGVTELAGSCFSNCQNMTEVTCLGNVTLINNYCFSGCQRLAKFVMPNLTAVPRIYNMNAFNSSPIRNGGGYVYVPDNLVEEMKVTNVWSEIADRIKGISELV